MQVASGMASDDQYQCVREFTHKFKTKMGFTYGMSASAWLHVVVARFLFILSHTKPDSPTLSGTKHFVRLRHKLQNKHVHFGFRMPQPVWLDPAQLLPIYATLCALWKSFAIIRLLVSWCDAYIGYATEIAFVSSNIYCVIRASSVMIPFP